MVAYVDGAGGQVWLAPGRQLTREPEGFREVAISGDGRVAFAVTRSGRLLRIDVAPGGVTEGIPRTPWIVNAGVFRAVAPGSLFALEGAGLAEATTAASTPLPRELAGVRVRIGGTDAAVQAVSPERVLIQTPWETPLDSAARFDFLSGNSLFETGPGTVSVVPRAPYAWNVAVHQDWRGLVTAADPARAGEAITLYFAGLGPVSPSVVTGGAAPAENPARVTEPLRCQFWDGGPNDSRLYFAGLAPGMVGVYQVTVETPTLRVSPAAVACDLADAATWTLVDVVPQPPL